MSTTPINTILRLCAALIVLLGTGCATYQPLDVAVVGLAPLPSTVFEQRLRVDLRVQNPNDRAFEGTGLTLRLTVNGQQLAQAVSAQPISVPRLGEARIQVEASTTLFDLARQILVLPERGSESMRYEIQGELHRAGMRPNLRFAKGGELAFPAGVRPRR